MPSMMRIHDLPQEHGDILERIHHCSHKELVYIPLVQQKLYTPLYFAASSSVLTALRM